MANGTIDRSLNGIARLIEDHRADGSPLIESPDVIDAIEEIVTDAGYLDTEGEESEESEEE